MTRQEERSSYGDSVRLFADSEDLGDVEVLLAGYVYVMDLPDGTQQDGKTSWDGYLDMPRPKLRKLFDGKKLNLTLRFPDCREGTAYLRDLDGYITGVGETPFDEAPDG